MSEKQSARLGAVERASLAIARSINEQPLLKRCQSRLLEGVSSRWVHHAIARRVYTDGLSDVQALRPERGVLFAANHRSFFDLWAAMLPLFNAPPPWFQRVCFPVRAEFFYDNPGGVLLNLALAAACMYPPVFRGASRSAHNEDSLRRLRAFIELPGAVVGIHPEGRRNPNPDPLALLPAQPGVGQLVVKARPTVLPVFVSGLSNNALQEVRLTLSGAQARYRAPIVTVYGAPVDCSEHLQGKPRLATYKRVADQILGAIRRCGQHARSLRAAIVARQRDAADGWLTGPRR